MNRVTLYGALIKLLGLAFAMLNFWCMLQVFSGRDTFIIWISVTIVSFVLGHEQAKALDEDIKAWREEVLTKKPKES